ALPTPTSTLFPYTTLFRSQPLRDEALFQVLQIAVGLSRFRDREVVGFGCGAHPGALLQRLQIFAGVGEPHNDADHQDHGRWSLHATSSSHLLRRGSRERRRVVRSWRRPGLPSTAAFA